MAFTGHLSWSINHTHIASSLTNFVVVVDVTAAALKTVANGGSVANTNGYDIVFSTDTAGASPLNWEVEFYDGAAGRLIAHVQIPTISNSSDTTFYQPYGNSAITTDQSNQHATWDSTFCSVTHYPTLSGCTSSSAIGNDSTSNGNNLTGYVCPNGISGSKIAYSVNMNASAVQFITKTSPAGGFPTGTAARTVETWFQNSGTFTGPSPFPESVLIGYGGSGNGSQFTIQPHTGDITLDVLNAGAVIFPCTGDANWHHVAAVVPAGATDLTTVALYLDGVALTGTLSGSSAFSTVATEYCLNGLPTFHNAGTINNVDESRVSNVARSPAWIAAHVLNVNSPSMFFSGSGGGGGGASARGNIDYDQIQVAARHGTQVKFQMSDGTGVSGNVPKFTADGSITDGGAAPGGGVPSVNSITGAVTIAAGPGATVSTAGSTITIGASGGGGGGALTQIAQVVVGAATPTITFSGIPGTFTNLKLVLNGQTSSGSADIVEMQFNADTGAHYDYQWLDAGTVTSANNATFAAFIFFAPSSATSRASSADVTIYSYANTTFFKTFSAHGEFWNGSNIRTELFAGDWQSTAAITSIKFFLSSGANFVTGTTATLYGMQ